MLYCVFKKYESNLLYKINLNKYTYIIVDKSFRIILEFIRIDLLNIYSYSYGYDKIFQKLFLNTLLLTIFSFKYKYLV